MIVSNIELHVGPEEWMTFGFQLLRKGTILWEVWRPVEKTPRLFNAGEILRIDVPRVEADVLRLHGRDISIRGHYVLVDGLRYEVPITPAKTWGVWDFEFRPELVIPIFLGGLAPIIAMGTVVGAQELKRIAQGIP